MTKERFVWLDYCKCCKRRHRVAFMKCPDCGVYETPQPVSDAVAENCGADYRCDGCLAYRDHLRY